MITIEEVATRTGLTRAAVAKRVGIAQPRLNSLLQGKLDQFDLDALVTIAAHAGLRIELGIVRWRIARPPVISRCGAQKATHSS